MVTGVRRNSILTVVRIGDRRSLLLRELVVTLNNTRRQNPQERSKNLYKFVTIQVSMVVDIKFRVFLGGI